MKGRFTAWNTEALWPTGTLIKHLDIFIDKLLIPVVLSLRETDKFLSLPARRKKGPGRGLFRALIDQAEASGFVPR